MIRCRIGRSPTLPPSPTFTIARDSCSRSALPSTDVADVLARRRESHAREVRHRPAARRCRAAQATCAAGASRCWRILPRSPRDLTHSLDALAALPDLQSDAPRSDPNMDCAATNRTTWSSRRISSIRSSASRSSACTAKCASPRRRCSIRSTSCWWTCRTSAAESILSSRRCGTCSRRRHARQERLGARPAESDRPAVEGTSLRAGWESFVGAGEMPMRHGLTLGEMGYWFIRRFELGVDYRVVEMAGWEPRAAPGLGWPLGERTWVNPSPNAPNFSWRAATRARSCSKARRFPKAAARPGRSSSSAHRRWISRPRRRNAAPGTAVARRLQAAAVLVRADVPQAPRAALCGSARARRRRGVRARGLPAVAAAGPGVQGPAHICEPHYPLWRDFAYEYEHGRLAIDLINGSESLREWVDDPAATPGDLEALARQTKQHGSRQSAAVRIYR